MNKINLGKINELETVRKNFFDQLKELYINKLNKSNDLTFNYYSIVDNWNDMLYNLANAKTTLDMLECADPVFDNSEYYLIKNDQFIRIYIDNDDVYLIVNNTPFNTANHIYITQKELGEL